MSADYRCTIVDDNGCELDLLLEVHDDGAHVIKTRPSNESGWISWSPPTTLQRVPISEVAS